MTNKNINCPSCDTVSTYEAWYEISNDFHAVCPSCDGVINFEEFEEETGISNI